MAGYDSARNIISIQYNHPDNPDNFSHITVIDWRKSLGALKAIIAMEIAVDTDAISLSRSARSSQLKDLTITMKSAGLVSDSVVFVSRSPQMTPEQYNLAFYEFHPSKPMKKLFDMPVSAK